MEQLVWLEAIMDEQCAVQSYSNGLYGQTYHIPDVLPQALVLSAANVDAIDCSYCVTTTSDYV